MLKVQDLVRQVHKVHQVLLDQQVDKALKEVEGLREHKELQVLQVHHQTKD